MSWHYKRTRAQERKIQSIIHPPTKPSKMILPSRDFNLLLISFLLLLLTKCAHSSSLTPGFYSTTCPEAESIVRAAIRRSMLTDPRSAASVLRLQFHDCFVNGCDASLLLDDTPTMAGEKNSLSNINSLRCYDVIDGAKAEVETACPGVVSCADIIAMAARDAVFLSGGPRWEVKLGRKDSLTASKEDSNNIMPSPRANATFLVDLFRTLNLSITDMVALSGSHTIGYGRCFSIVFRLYNQSDPDMDGEFRGRLEGLCPSGGDGEAVGGLDATPTVFDNRYFKDLVGMKGFLNSDQTLFSGDERTTMEAVRRFAEDEKGFFDAFVEGMVKMGDLGAGNGGEIRRNCRVVNGGDGKIDVPLAVAVDVGKRKSGAGSRICEF